MEDDEFPGDDAFPGRSVLAAVLEASGVAVWQVDLTQRRARIGAAAKRMLGFTADHQSDDDGLIALLHPPAVDGAKDYQTEFRLGAADPSKWFSVHGQAVTPNDGATRPADIFVGTLRDITERKTADAAFQAAIDQQRNLLHEVNHRVKNSLQLVSSLLRLQAMRVQEGAARRQLEHATARISTIAHIHERLYRDQDIHRIRFGAFVNELCSDLQVSAPLCSLKVNTPEFLVLTEKVIPLALIIGEIVTNAFTYAYPGGGGPVTVKVEKPDDGHITISIADEGVGLPEGFSVDGAQSLGMILIASMVRQLSAHLDVRTGPTGATFVITAPVSNVGD